MKGRNLCLIVKCNFWSI
uniref:Uncharacterized protein n=1 Tax=Rhizophora mucronata TaxID=61149 RepID=A0A2P2QD20_RHIMU